MCLFGIIDFSVVTSPLWIEKQKKKKPLLSGKYPFLSIYTKRGFIASQKRYMSLCSLFLLFAFIQSNSFIHRPFSQQFDKYFHYSVILPTSSAVFQKGFLTESEKKDNRVLTLSSQIFTLAPNQIGKFRIVDKRISVALDSVDSFVAIDFVSVRRIHHVPFQQSFQNRYSA